MPEIKVYNNTVEGIRPSERGIDATLQVARRAGAFFNQAADATQTVGNQGARGYASAIKEAGDVAVSFAEHQEVSMGAPAFAGLTDMLGRSWDDTIKGDPNDPLLAQKFREQQLEPEIERFKSSFNTEGGRKWAQSHADGLRTHLYQKTAADMGTLAANAVGVRMRETINGLSNAAMRDPSSVDFLIKSVDSSVAGMVDSNPNLRGVQADTTRTKLSEAAKDTIVKAAAIGAIQNSSNPEAAAARFAAKYPQYISGAELKQLESAARTEIRARNTDARANEILQERREKKVSNEVARQYEAALYSDDPQKQAQVSAKAIIADTRLTREDRHDLVRRVERELKPETEKAVSARTMREAFGGISSGAITEVKQIDELYLKGDLTHSDRALLVKDFHERQSPQNPVYKVAMDAAKDAIEVKIPGMAGRDPIGAAKYAGFVSSFLPEYLKLRDSGKLPDNALDVSDPKSMISQRMAPFKRSQAQMISDYVAGAGGANAPAAAPAAKPRMIDGVQVPTPLMSVPSLARNKSTGEWRDGTGKIYTPDGALK